MSTPPRRRRTESRRSSGGGRGGWLPSIAMALGVIVAGLGIGALVAVFMQRGTNNAPVIAAMTAAPTAPTPSHAAAVVIATLAPRRTPRPSPSPSAFVSAAPAPSARPTSAASASPSSTAPAASTTGSAPAAADAPSSPPGPDASTVAVATHPPAAAPTVMPATAAAPAVTPSAAPPSGYDERASAVVRRYLDALIRGDSQTARGTLGAGGATSGGDLTEQSFLDSSARIVSIKVTKIDASNASVGCEIASAKGHYYATYHVMAAGSGPFISEHDYIKVGT